MQRYKVFSDWAIFLFSATNGCRFISAQYFFSSALLPLILRPCYGVASLLGVEQGRRMTVEWGGERRWIDRLNEIYFLESRMVFYIANMFFV